MYTEKANIKENLKIKLHNNGNSDRYPIEDKAEEMNRTKHGNPSIRLLYTSTHHSLYAVYLPLRH